MKCQKCKEDGVLFAELHGLLASGPWEITAHANLCKLCTLAWEKFAYESDDVFEVWSIVLAESVRLEAARQFGLDIADPGQHSAGIYQRAEAFIEAKRQAYAEIQKWLDTPVDAK